MTNFNDTTTWIPLLYLLTSFRIIKMTLSQSLPYKNSKIAVAETNVSVHSIMSFHELIQVNECAFSHSHDSQVNSWYIGSEMKLAWLKSCCQFWQFYRLREYLAASQFARIDEQFYIIYDEDNVFISKTCVKQIFQMNDWARKMT